VICAIVVSAPLRVGQELVRLNDLREAARVSFAPGDVGMTPASHPSKRRFDRCVVGRSKNPEHAVVVFDRHDRSPMLR